jgi:hypothetical protein
LRALEALIQLRFLRNRLASELLADSSIYSEGRPHALQVTTRRNLLQNRRGHVEKFDGSDLFKVPVGISCNL